MHCCLLLRCQPLAVCLLSWLSLESLEVHLSRTPDSMCRARESVLPYMYSRSLLGMQAVISLSCKHTSVIGQLLLTMIILVYEIPSRAQTQRHGCLRSIQHEGSASLQALGALGRCPALSLPERNLGTGVRSSACLGSGNWAMAWTSAPTSHTTGLRRRRHCLCT